MPSGRFDDFVTRFEVPQYGVVYSRWLRVPELLLFASMLAGFFLYHMCWQLGIFQKSRVETIPLVSALKPGKGLMGWLEDPGNNRLGAYKPDVSSLPFCKQSGSGLARLPCKDFPRNLIVVPSRDDGAMNLASAMRERSFVPDAPDHKGPLYSVSAFDQMILWAQLGNTGWDDFHFPRAQGFMKFKGEQELRIIPRVGGGEEQPFPLTGAEAACGDAESLPYAGMDYLRRGLCANTRFGALFSFSTLLRAANVTLDGEHDRRSHGFVLKVLVEFTNMDPADFWRWPIGFKTRFTVEPTLDMSSNDVQPDFGFCSDLEGTRCVDRRGAIVQLQVHGVFGRFSWAYAVARLSVASICLGAGKFFASQVLAALYRYKKGLQHVHVLHSVAAYEMYDEDARVEGLLAQGHTPEAVNDIYRRRSKDAPVWGERGASEEASLSSDNS